jgi:hypothetical protein
MSVLSVVSDANDVEATMAAVADALRRWEGGAARPLDLATAPGQEEELAIQASRLRLQWNVDGGAIIHSTRPRLGPWIIRFQTAVRRATWWFLEPVLQQIRSFQMSAARVAERTARDQAVLRARLEGLEDELAELKRQVAREDSD